jgi:3-oxoacyl-(acyl-carrier-protein) synthase
MTHPLFIRAVGAVTAAGTGVPPLEAVLTMPEWQPSIGLDRPDAQPLPVATCRSFDPKGALPPLVARRLDRPARLLAVAAKECLSAEGDQLPGPRTSIGITAGTWNAGTTALLEVLRAVFFVNPDEAPPAQFPSTVANAPASQLGILEQLGGPNLTFAEKQVGGLRAVIEACRLVTRHRASLVLACGVDEANWLNAEGYDRLRSLERASHPGMTLGEGAAVVSISDQPGSQPLARVAGQGCAAALTAPYLYSSHPEALVAACQRALESAEIPANAVDIVVSMANGSPALAKLESTAYQRVFGQNRPAAFALSDRLGDGAFSSALRVLAAALVLGRGVLPVWPSPQHLETAGFPTISSRPRTALVAGTAGGGSALAVLLTAP